MSASVDYIFSKLIQEHLIHDWKANDFWIKIQDYGVESNEKNRQRLYRLLRKHVGQQRFVKKTNSFNRKLSSYSETSQLALLRSKLSEQTIYLELKRVEVKTKELIALQQQLYFQVQAADKALQEFPKLKNVITQKKSKIQCRMKELDAYAAFLSSLR